MTEQLQALLAGGVCGTLLAVASWVVIGWWVNATTRPIGEPLRIVEGYTAEEVLSLKDLPRPGEQTENGLEVESVQAEPIGGNRWLISAKFCQPTTYQMDSAMRVTRK